MFAALNILHGTVIGVRPVIDPPDRSHLGLTTQKHRHQEFIRFLNAVEREVPPGKIIHVILDNYGTHKHPKVMASLTRHPRFIFHFTPTSCSWLNAVESFFAKLTKRRLKRGVFHSIVDLQAAIKRYIDQHNDDPKPFTWTKSAKTIIEKLNPMNALGWTPLRRHRCAKVTVLEP